ncbi:MAG: T9SS type A sorting domain-containing protein [Candidatus Electryonea clarkiae]|nr:T9SS type A sorting domain-containing protein [Candidatus Electryonea clarkiae]MDP8286225.1 T9SS type A sorting domain-containing protein [Candidatus Electryonea clarkiae]
MGRTLRIRIFTRVLILLNIFFISSVFANESIESFWPMTSEIVNISEQVDKNAVSHTLKGTFNSENGAPVRVTGGLPQIQYKSSLGVDEIRTFIDANPDFFNLKSSDLEILHSGNIHGKTYFTSRQLIDNRPVLDTRLLLRIAKNGNILLWGADVFPRDNKIWNANISTELAAGYLAEYSETDRYTIGSVQEVWTRINNTVIAAYLLQLRDENPANRPVGLVSAEDGTILGYYNGVYHSIIEGAVQGPMLPVRWNDDPVWMEFPNQRIDIGREQIFTDDDGEYSLDGLTEGEDYNFRMRLQGRWVSVSYDHGANASFSILVTAPEDFSPLWFSPGDGRIDEFNMFYHANFIHAFYKDLDSGFNMLDYSMPAVVGYGNNYQNAFWNGEGMYFGAGGGNMRNLALFSDIIYHEYTHGVTGAIYSFGELPYRGQSGALNEAWSDYFPCSIHNHSTLAPGVYSNEPGGSMRNLDNNRRYPENWVGEVHGDGLIVGGSMWDVREELGAQYCDSLFHYARYGLANTFVGFLQEVLVYDDDDGDFSNGTPNDEVIYRGFGGHGIGPSEIPNLVIRNLQITDENDDGELWHGERVEIDFRVLNDVILHPPAAQNVIVTAENLDFINWQVNGEVLGEIGAGVEVGLSEPLSFTVLDNAPTRHIDLVITISANDRNYITEYTERITFGDPEILLIDDGGRESYYERYDAAVVDLWTAANFWNTEDGNVSQDRMTEHDVVIWYTGDNHSPLSEAEMELMQTYVDNGGGLILTGQHIGPQLADHSDFADFIGVDESIDSLRELAVYGSEGQDLSDGILAALIGSPGAGNQVSPSGINPTEQAEAVYNYYGSDEIAATWKSFDDGGNVFYFGFGLEAVSGASISDPAGRILRPIIEAMGYELDVPATASASSELPKQYSLSIPYPNPFNPVAHINYALPSDQLIKLNVVNILGQEMVEIFHGRKNAGYHEAVVDLSGHASGLYLFRLETPAGVHVQKGILIK